MSVHTVDDLARIIAQHRADVAAARMAADQRSRHHEDARHECEAPLREVAMPLFGEWSKRLSVEGYPTSVEDLLGCHPPSLVFRLTPKGATASSLSLVCHDGPAVRFTMNIDGKDVGDDLESPLAEVDSQIVLDALGRFVTAALAATIPKRSDCRG